MIKSFKYKGLEDFFYTGSKKEILPNGVFSFGLRMVMLMSLTMMIIIKRYNYE